MRALINRHPQILIVLFVGYMTLAVVIAHGVAALFGMTLSGDQVASWTGVTATIMVVIYFLADYAIGSHDANV